MQSQWKKNLGASLKATGITIFGSGGVTLLTGVPNWVKITLIVVGVLCSVTGTFFDHLWNNDQAAAVAAVTSQAASNAQAITTKVDKPV
jgi:hypothetical protein